MCVATILINISQEPWNGIDYSNKLRAEHRCRVKFPQSPCLKVFTKVEPRVYRAICGIDQ